MSAPAPQVVQLACPNCRTPLRAQIFTLVDVGQQPELKNYLLSGQLNMVACPNCGNVSMLAAPLIYHDPSKQLFFVHFPQQLNASTQDQEKFVGDATSLIMRSLPENMPKGYLLAPRRFLSLNSLIEAVLEADGITKEMIEAQQRRVDLIGQLAEAYEQGEEQLAQLVEQRRADIDYEFMATLTAFAEASVRSQQDESAQILIGLRDKLVELVGFDDEPGDEQDVSLDDALDRLTSVPDEELELAVGELRPLIDYSFFEELTSRIDAATQAGDAETAQRLTSRRQQIVEMVERLDAQAKELFEAGANLLNAVLAADDPDAVLRERHEEIGEAFMLVLEANQVAAERAGRADMVERLADIRDRALVIAQESLPPEEKLINQLLQAETPQESSQLLRQNMGMVNTAFVKRINEMADQFEKDGRQALGARLRQIGREAGAMLF
jgi:hypothetical protein